MRNIVLDTNVIVSAIITPQGNSAQIYETIKETGKIRLIYADEILSEYRRVLNYAKLKISFENQQRHLKEIENAGLLIEPPKSDIPFAHEPDRIFYDAAKASQALLITGNIKHFPQEEHIILPAVFVENYSDFLLQV